MTSSSAESYEVGYKKPPKTTRFKKGESGNPNGRSKKINAPLNPGAVLQAIENEKISVMLDNGKRKPMTKLEAHFRQLFKKAIDGDLKAAALLVKMAEDFFAPDAIADSPPEVIGESKALRRYGKNWPEKVKELNAPYQVSDE